MGCGQSKRTFIVNELIEGQNQDALNILLSFGLELTHVNMLYAAFCTINKASNTSIKIVDLLTYFHLKNENFERHIFSLFDGDRLGVLNFLEFATTMWNLLTLTDRNLGMIAYMMKDPSGAMKIRFSEIQSILETIHLKKLEAVPVIHAIFLTMKESHPSEISMQEFCKVTETHITIIQPLLVIQLTMRRSLINERYWNHAALLRNEDKDKGHFGYVRKVQLNIRLKNEAFRKKRHDEEISKQVKSSKSQKVLSVSNLGATTATTATVASSVATAAVVASGTEGETKCKVEDAVSNKGGDVVSDAVVSTKEKKKKSKSTLNDPSIKSSAVAAITNVQDSVNHNNNNIGGAAVGSEKRKPVSQSKSSKKLNKSVRVIEYHSSHLSSV